MYLSTFIHFDLIANLDIIIVLDANTAFEALLDFTGIVLKATQGFQFPFVNHHVVTQHPYFFTTPNRSLGDKTPGNCTYLWSPENIPDFDPTGNFLFDLRRE